MIKGRTRIVGAVAALSLLVAACGGGSGAAPADGTYEVGIAMALSGPQAAFGKDFGTFFEYGIADANKELAAEGIKLVTKMVDNKATPEGGVAAFNKLASVDRVPLVLSGWSAVVNAMAPLANSSTAVLNVGANDPSAQGASPMLASFFTLANVEMTNFATFVHDEMKFDDAAVIYVNNPTGIGGAESFRDTWESLDGTVTAFESVAPGAVDVSSTVTKVLARDPQVVHVHTTSTEAGAVIKALRGQGFTGQIVSYAGAIADDSARKVAGKDANGVVYSQVRTYDSESAEIKDLLARFNTDKGRDPNGLVYSAAFYDSAWLYGELIKKLEAEGKDITGENMIAAMKGATFEVPLEGEVTFTDDLVLRSPTEAHKITDASKPAGSDELVKLIETN